MKLAIPNFTKNTKQTGAIGEQVAAQYLKRLGYHVIERNYLNRLGEVDLITQKGPEIQFVEVKSVTHETRGDLEWAVSHETWQPEELVHQQKLQKVAQVAEMWCQKNYYEGSRRLLVAAVHYVSRETYATVKLLEI